MTKAVLFDYGGVLSRAEDVRISDILYRLGGFELEKDQLSELIFRGVIGKGSENDFVDLINSRKSSSDELITIDDWFKEAESLLTTDSELIEYAHALVARGLKAGILSNVFIRMAEKLHEVGNYDGFDPVILSCEVGLRKPQPEMYQLALERLGLLANEVIFVDDQERCLDPAREMGFVTVLAQSTEQVISDIDKILKSQD